MAFLQTPLTREFKTNASSYSSSNNSDLKKVNDPNEVQDEDDESDSDASTNNKDINGKDNTVRLFIANEPC